MYAIRVNKNIKANQVSSRTQSVHSDSNLIGFFIGDYKMRPFCKCGCYKSTTRSKIYPYDWNIFIHGHNKNRIGIKHSKETKRKISKSLKGCTPWNKGGTMSIECKQKLSKYHLGKSLSELGHKVDCSCCMCRAKRHEKRKPLSEETKRKISESHKGKYVSKETRRKMSDGQKRMCRQNPKYVEERVRAMIAGQTISFTKPERRLKNRLNHLFPNEYKYVGDGTIWIGRKCPDFINVNGQKKIIEMFGEFWHGKKRTRRTKKQEENQRIKHFAKYGFKTLIVWENELKNMKQLKRKLIKFHLRQNK